MKKKRTSKLLDRDKIINSYEEIYKPKEPIPIENLIEKSSKSNSAKALIYGKAGIGKTTFCKYYNAPHKPNHLIQFSYSKC